MTEPNLFGIGVYADGTPSIQGLAANGIVEPLWDYKAFQTMRIGGGALGVAVGWPSAEWSWKFLHKDERDFLYNFCSGISAKVLIKTKITTTTWGVFSATMYWPERERWDSEHSMDIAINFGDLVTAV